jgi:hypothetical protein
MRIRISKNINQEHTWCDSQYIYFITSDTLSEEYMSSIELHKTGNATQNSTTSLAYATTSTHRGRGGGQDLAERGKGHQDLVERGRGTKIRPPSMGVGRGNGEPKFGQENHVPCLLSSVVAVRKNP